MAPWTTKVINSNLDRVTHANIDSVASKLVKIVETRSQVQKLAVSVTAKIARWYTPMFHRRYDDERRTLADSFVASLVQQFANRRKPIRDVPTPEGLSGVPLLKADLLSAWAFQKTSIAPIATSLYNARSLSIQDVKAVIVACLDRAYLKDPDKVGDALLLLEHTARDLDGQDARKVDDIFEQLKSQLDAVPDRAHERRKSGDRIIPSLYDRYHVLVRNRQNNWIASPYGAAFLAGAQSSASDPASRGGSALPLEAPSNLDSETEGEDGAMSRTPVEKEGSERQSSIVDAVDHLENLHLDKPERALSPWTTYIAGVTTDRPDAKEADETNSTVLGADVRSHLTSDQSVTSLAANERQEHISPQQTQRANERLEQMSPIRDEVVIKSFDVNERGMSGRATRKAPTLHSNGLRRSSSGRSIGRQVSKPTSVVKFEIVPGNPRNVSHEASERSPHSLSQVAPLSSKHNNYHSIPWQKSIKAHEKGGADMAEEETANHITASHLRIPNSIDSIEEGTENTESEEQQGQTFWPQSSNVEPIMPSVVSEESSVVAIPRHEATHLENVAVLPSLPSSSSSSSSHSNKVLGYRSNPPISFDEQEDAVWIYLYPNVSSPTRSTFAEYKGGLNGAEVKVKVGSNIKMGEAKHLAQLFTFCLERDFSKEEKDSSSQEEKERRARSIRFLDDGTVCQLISQRGEDDGVDIEVFYPESMRFADARKVGNRLALAYSEERMSKKERFA